VRVYHGIATWLGADTPPATCVDDPSSNVADPAPVIATPEPRPHRTVTPSAETIRVAQAAAVADPVTVPALSPVIVESVPSQPREVTLDYPDGDSIPVAYQYVGPAGTREQWMALVPASARLANGMVIRINRGTVLAVALKDAS
jgi:hypothetical protein